MIHFLKKYWLSTLVIIVILILCFINTKPLPTVPVHDFDKIVHLIMFLGLSGVIFFDSTRYLRFPISNLRIFWSTFFFPSALGGLIEILQGALTKTRSADWRDFVFDIFGTIIGMGIALFINHFFLKKGKLSLG